MPELSTILRPQDMQRLQENRPPVDRENVSILSALCALEWRPVIVTHHTLLQDAPLLVLDKPVLFLLGDSDEFCSTNQLKEIATKIPSPDIRAEVIEACSSPPLTSLFLEQHSLPSEFRCSSCM